jgi:hypothetical protein
LYVAEFSDGRDTLKIMYGKEGKTEELRRKVNGRIQELLWYKNSTQLREEHYFNPKTNYRDSVWRVWSENGTLLAEKSYDNGKYLSTTIDKQIDHTLIFPVEQMRHTASMAASNNSAFKRQSWDTSFYVPRQTVDTVALNIARVASYTTKSGNDWGNVPLRIDSTFPQICMKSVDATYTKFESFVCVKYQLTLVNVDTCTKRNGHWYTGNSALDRFLDSLPIFKIDKSFSTFIKRGWFRRSETFYVDFFGNDTLLNTSFINRRLNELQRGSKIVAFRQNITRFPADVIYFASGTQTDSSQLPFTLVAFAEKWLHEGERNPSFVDHRYYGYDMRIYHAYIVYGDGEVEPVFDGSAAELYARFGLVGRGKSR